MSALIQLAAEHWQFVSPLLRKPKNEADYDALVTALDELLDLVGEDESNPLMSLVDILSDWIEAYDHEHRPMPVASGADVQRTGADARAGHDPLFDGDLQAGVDIMSCARPTTVMLPSPSHLARSPV